MTRKELQAVWDRIPSTNCKGLCVDACGPIGASRLELQMVAERGVVIEDANPTAVFLAFLHGEDLAPCPALVDGRCSVYDVRPTVCRLWGAVEEMPCRWGCVPVGGRLTTEEGHELIRAAEEANR